MEDQYLALLIGNIITTFPAIIHSIWWETRFVKKLPAFLYGLAALGSGALLYANLGATEIGFWAIGTFLVLGVVYLIACWKLDIWGEENISLPFSHKTIGGFQIAFLYYLYLVPIFGNLPLISNSLSMAQNVVVWGVIITILLYVGTLIAKIYKNR